MDAKLNHSDITALLAKKSKLSGAKAEVFTKAFFDIIIEGLEKDGLVKINGLGTFKVTDVASRESVNVNTGEKFEIKGHKKLTFLPADTLKEKVNKPFAMFEPVEIDDSYVDDSNSGTTRDEEEPASDDVLPAAIETVAEDTENAVEPVAIANPIENTETPEPAVQEVEEEEKTVSAANNVEEPVAEECAIAAAPAETEQTAVVTPEKNAKETTATEPAKKSSKGKTIAIAFLVVLLIALLAISVPSLLVILAGKKTTVVPAAKIEPAIAATVTKTDTAVVDKDSVIVPVAIPEPVAVYTFELVEELANKRVGAVTVGDTLLYRANGSIEKHIVAENETLTRIALKYYGDKRLWPYIVQYNRLSDPNGLNKGMELEIPRLEPVK
ncbi:MAG: HU family DNA-binding protein [Bacteroidaceae bacterium]|nr:HU family DNA-binding protein [Bacteroidaceae bacterium]